MYWYCYSTIRQYFIPCLQYSIPSCSGILFPLFHEKALHYRTVHHILTKDKDIGVLATLKVLLYI